MKDTNRYNQKRKRNNNGRKYNNHGQNKAHLRAQAQKMYDKYLKEAQMASEPYFQEYYLQHADHYYRVLQELRDDHHQNQKPKHNVENITAVVIDETADEAAIEDDVKKDSSKEEERESQPPKEEEKTAIEEPAKPQEEEKPKPRRGRRKKMDPAPFIAETSPVSMDDLALVSKEKESGKPLTQDDV